MRTAVLGLMVLGVACTATRNRPGEGGGPAAPATAAAPAGLTGAEIDHLIEARWKQAGVTVSAPADDGEYLRRLCLDLVGRVPTLLETKTFLADTRPDKRERMVDTLLASGDFAEHWADVYGDLLFHTEGKNKIERRFDPREWLVRAFTENWRYDRLSYEILTATGDVQENGALAFLAARAKGGGGPEAVTGAAARVFLGLQIQCAQCHDHPYDTRWKQEDFYGLVAYFARTKAKQENNMMAMGKTFVVFDQRRGEAKMHKPRAEGEVTVAPRFLGARPSERPGETRRQTFARALLASDLFPKTMVARTWTQLFGHGLVDPWDDLGGENDPKHPELLVKLADDFRNAGFDIKHLIRQIVLSTAYARSSAAVAGAGDDGGAAVRAFARAGIRPLSPEQLFRTILTVTGVDGMAKRRMGDEKVEKRMAAALREFQFAFDDDEMAEANSFDGSMPQALMLLNGELTNNGTRAAEVGVLGEILRGSRDPATRLEQMFLAVYSRRPTSEERTLLAESLRRADPRRAFEDIYFALLTSTEAVTNH
jgi:hypothetical protein